MNEHEIAKEIAISRRANQAEECLHMKKIGISSTLNKRDQRKLVKLSVHKQRLTDRQVMDERSFITEVLIHIVRRSLRKHHIDRLVPKCQN